MVLVEESVRNEIDQIKNSIKKHCEWNRWIFVEDPLIKNLLGESKEVYWMENFVGIDVEGIAISTKPHNSMWWKIHKVLGEKVCFDEPENPEGIVFIKVQ